MIKRHVNLILAVIVCVFVAGTSVNAFHSETRYFPWLEKTESIILKKQSQFNPEVFYISAATASKRGGGTGGIPELWGSYALSDVAKSCEQIFGLGADYISNQMGGAPFDNNALVYNYKISGKVSGQGLGLGYDHDLKKYGLSVGMWLPVAHISATSNFELEGNASTQFESRIRKLTDLEVNKLDKIRRDLHERMGFQGDAWGATGVGDLDVHVRWNYFMDHKWLMRGIDSYVQVGILCPTGAKTSVSEPLSVPLGSNGHWGLYFDALPEFELKQDWKLGVLFGALYQFKNSRNMRLPLGKEPVPFSPLVGRVEIDPGVTMKFSPYFTLENLTDGVHFQFRYTYLKHTADRWKDVRSDKATRSYLDGSVSSVGLSADDMANNIASKKTLSKWSSHYASFQMIYDSKQALKNWALSPTLYAVYDFPISGSGVAKVHQASLGAYLHF